MWGFLPWTRPPALTARGACTADTLAPGENKAMSTPLKSNLSRSCTLRTSSSPNDTSPPAERSEATAQTSDTGNARSARMLNISWPTTPVAPTTATLNAISDTPGKGDSRRGLLHLRSPRPIDKGRATGKVTNYVAFYGEPHGRRQDQQLRGVLAPLPPRPCGPAHPRHALLRHVARCPAAPRLPRDQGLALPRRRADRRLRLRLDRACDVRAKQARHLRSPVVAVLRRFLHALSLDHQPPRARAGTHRRRALRQRQPQAPNVKRLPMLDSTSFSGI